MFPNKLFQKFCRERNVKESTKQGYESALKSYTQYHQESLNTLLDEAISEENQNIPLKNRKIKKRLLSYRSYLLKSKSSPNTVRTYFTKVKTFIVILKLRFLLFRMLSIISCMRLVIWICLLRVIFSRLWILLVWI